ncbi:hypothetical protein B0H14DRAFT_3763642 [Mycena olivaceomarginata]|nr:hypothetical protein B0H14DRAFT_3763642 [Mycena olivaceomarginata]
MASPTEITAFVVALVALVIALLQVVQQYMASSILRSKVGRAAIGTWAQRNRLRLNLSEFKFRQEYLQPTLTWGRVIVCVMAQKKAELNFVSALGDRFHVGTSSGSVFLALAWPESHGFGFLKSEARPKPKPGLSLALASKPKSHGFWRGICVLFGFGLTKSQAKPTIIPWLGFGFGTKAKKPWLFGLRPKPEKHYPAVLQLIEVPRTSLSWADRRAVTRHAKFLADRHNARRAICIASWSNMMASLVGNPVYLAEYSSESDEEDDLFGSKVCPYRDADTIPSALDNPPLDIHFTDLISCGVALDMEIRGYDLHKPALHMTSQYCSIVSQEHSGVGVIARYMHNPNHVHHIETCTPHEVDYLVKTAKGYLRIGDFLAHTTDWGYNSVNALFGIVVSRAPTDDWHQIAIGEQFRPLCEGDGDIQWKGRWSRPMTTRVGLLLTHCGNPAIANSFPHSLLSEWPDFDRIFEGSRPNPMYAVTTIRRAPKSRKFPDNPLVELPGACWEVDSQAEEVPILGDLRALLQEGGLTPTWGKKYTSKLKRFSDEQPGWKAEAQTLCWIQCMMLDTWIARRASVPVDSVTAKNCAKMAVAGDDEFKGKTTGWKRCRAAFSSHYLTRLADGIIEVDTGASVGVSCATGWKEMPKGSPNDWATLDAVLSLRAVVMATRLELMYNTDVFLELLEFDPMIRMA